MTPQEIVQHKVEGRVLTYMHRVKTQYERVLYTIVGRGVTPEEYTAICDKLVEKGALNRAFGNEGAPILQWVE